MAVRTGVAVRAGRRADVEPLERRRAEAARGLAGGDAVRVRRAERWRRDPRAAVGHAGAGHARRRRARRSRASVDGRRETARRREARGGLIACTQERTEEKNRTESLHRESTFRILHGPGGRLRRKRADARSPGFSRVHRGGASAHVPNPQPRGCGFRTRGSPHPHLATPPRAKRRVHRDYGGWHPRCSPVARLRTYAEPEELSPCPAARRSCSPLASRSLRSRSRSLPREAPGADRREAASTTDLRPQRGAPARIRRRARPARSNRRTVRSREPAAASPRARSPACPRIRTTAATGGRPVVGRAARAAVDRPSLQRPAASIAASRTGFAAMRSWAPSVESASRMIIAA